MNLNLSGKTAIVTGASKCIGKGIASALAKEGVNLGMCARGQEALERTAKELKGMGIDVFSKNCDEAGLKLNENMQSVFGELNKLETSIITYTDWIIIK